MWVCDSMMIMKSLFIISENYSKKKEKHTDWVKGKKLFKTKQKKSTQKENSHQKFHDFQAPSSVILLLFSYL